MLFGPTANLLSIKALNPTRETLNWECHERLNTVGSINKIWVLWLPVHIGLDDKEALGELARKATGTPLQARTLLWNRK